jgi:hypothetical protein
MPSNIQLIIEGTLVYSLLAVRLPFRLTYEVSKLALEALQLRWNTAFQESRHQVQSKLANQNAEAYSALDPDSRQIRLINLLPGEKSDMIECNLFLGH